MEYEDDSEFWNQFWIQPDDDYLYENMEVLNQTPPPPPAQPNMSAMVQAVSYDGSDNAGKYRKNSIHTTQKYSPYKLPTDGNCSAGSISRSSSNSILEHSSSSTPTADATLCRAFNDQDASINPASNEVIEPQQLQGTPPAQNMRQNPAQASINVSQQKSQCLLPPARQLSDLRVQDLKAECKSRSLPVSGSKPHLVDRLQQYEKEILESRNRGRLDFLAQSKSSLEDYFVNSVEIEHQGMAHNNQVMDDMSNGIGKSTQQPKVNRQNSHKQQSNKNFIGKQLVVEQKKGHNPSSQLVQLVDSNGKVVGTATMQVPISSELPNEFQMQQPITLSSSPVQPQQPLNYGAPTAPPPTQFIQKTENTYRFSQLGSGGQFTLAENNIDYGLKQEKTLQHETIPYQSNHNHPLQNLGQAEQQQQQQQKQQQFQSNQGNRVQTAKRPKQRRQNPNSKPTQTNQFQQDLQKMQSTQQYLTQGGHQQFESSNVQEQIHFQPSHQPDIAPTQQQIVQNNLDSHFPQTQNHSPINYHQQDLQNFQQSSHSSPQTQLMSSQQVSFQSEPNQLSLSNQHHSSPQNQGLQNGHQEIPFQQRQLHDQPQFQRNIPRNLMDSHGQNQNQFRQNFQLVNDNHFPSQKMIEQTQVTEQPQLGTRTQQTVVQYNGHFSPESCSNEITVQGAIRNVQVQNNVILPQNLASHNINQPNKTVHGSPVAGDQAGASPNLPVSETMYQNSIGVEDVNGGIQLIFDSRATQKLLSPKTLQLHEEMLKDQQHKINELMRMLGNNEKILKHQQELILEAKKAQQMARKQQNKQETIEQTLMNSGDVRLMNNQHVRRFLTHKVQQNHINTLVEEHTRLHKTETRLVEELHVGTAVEDIVRLIKQDARTALLIVSLLHKYRIERDEQHQAAVPSTSSPTVKVEKKPENAAPTRSRKGSSGRKTARQQSQSHAQKILQAHAVRQAQLSSAQAQKSGTNQREDVDMEEIFKTVIEDASRTAESYKTLNMVTVQDAARVAQMPRAMHSTSVDQKTQKVQQSMSVEMEHSSTPIHSGSEGSPEVLINSHVEVYQEQSQMAPIRLPPCEYLMQNCAMPAETTPMQNMMNRPNDAVSQQHHQMPNGIYENDPFPNLDDMVLMNDNDQLKINMDSDELANILGDDWLDTASRNINNHGQYDPQSPSKSEQQVPEVIYIHNDEMMGQQQQMEWLDHIMQDQQMMTNSYE